MNDFKAFADSKDFEKITAFLQNGLYISNTMLVMEHDLTRLCEVEDEDKVSLYDTWDLTEYLTANGLGFGTSDPEEKVLEQLSNPNSNIYVLRVDGQVASSVTVWDYDEDTVATENIFTVPQFRENHYAWNLLNKVLWDIKARKKKKARLTVYGDDTVAIAMYLKMGYRLTGVLQEFMYDDSEE